MTVRWTVSDGVDTYTFEINPKEMTSPHGVYTRESLPAAVNGTSVRVQETKTPKAVEWSFSGRIYTQQQYDNLLEWTDKGEILTLTDHLGRSAQVIFTAFKPSDYRRPATTIRWDYEVTAIILGELS